MKRYIVFGFIVYEGTYLNMIIGYYDTVKEIKDNYVTDASNRGIYYDSIGVLDVKEQKEIFIK